MDDLGWSEEGGEQGARRPGFPVDPYRVKRALYQGRFWLIGAAIFGVSFGFFWAKVVMDRWYESTAVLRYEGDIQIAGLERPAGYALGPAADALLRESLLRKLRDETGYEGSLISLESAIEYEVDLRAGTLRIIVAGDTAESAAEFANAVTEVFLEYHRERQARRIEAEIQRVTTRLEGAEDEAREARERYNEFRERHGIAHLSTEQRTMVDSAARLRADSEMAGSEIRALEAEVQSLETQLKTIPKTSVVSSSSPEREAYNQLRQQLASARATLSEEHPRVQALRMQVDELRSHIRAGGGSEGLVGSNSTYTTLSEQLRESKSELITLRERQRGLAEMADRAQVRIESFSGIEGEASALLAEVEVNENLIARLHATEAALEDALERPPSGFSVLDPGSLPEHPVRNEMKLVAFAAISVLSVLLALGFVFWRELRGLRLETPTEVAFWGNGPVLGTTSWPADEHGLDELIAGLDDLAPEADGTLLIVTGTRNDAPLARELAHRMNDDWFLDGSLPQSHAAPPPPGPTPITTPPPPSGPYPIGGAAPKPASPAAAEPGTALALQPVQLVRREHHLRMDAWEGPFEGQALRRAARLADRVMVLVRSGAMSAVELSGVKRRIGREAGVGYVVIALPQELHALPDRVGKVARFWDARA